MWQLLSVGTQERVSENTFLKLILKLEEEFVGKKEKNNDP